MRTKMFYAIAIAICGAVGMNSCTKDYDDVTTCVSNVN